jgi:hypothetical protein
MTGDARAGRVLSLPRAEFRERHARRRLVALLREERVPTPRIGPALLRFLLILLLALHGGLRSGFFTLRPTAVTEGVPQAARRNEPSHEVDDMRIQLAVGVLAIGAAGSTALGTDRSVPGEYPTVQAAHDAASDGDRIVLAPGIYPMQEWQLSKSISIESAAGPLSTVISGAVEGASERAFSVSGSSSDGTTRITGLSFFGGTGSNIDSSNVHIERCRFVASGGPKAYGGALRLVGAGSIRLERCAFESCVASGAGAVGVLGAVLTAVDCVFLNNAAVWVGGPSEGGAVHMVGSSGSFERCVFVGNTADIGGAICRWWNYPSVQVSNSRFGANSSDWNCCVQCSGCGSASQSEFEADCNSNGVPDRIETLVHPSGDLDGDSIPDACQCSGDIVRDGAVNAADLAVVLVAWGTSDAQYPGADIDGNGVVDGSDLGAVLAAWGPCPE